MKQTTLANAHITDDDVFENVGIIVRALIRHGTVSIYLRRRTREIIEEENEVIEQGSESTKKGEKRSNKRSISSIVTQTRRHSISRRH